MTTAISIYTDGACRGNPGIGGWGALLQSGARRKSICGGERDTTNNRMEMTAAIMALRALKRPSVVDLYTDSAYLKDGVQKWLPNWKRNNWRTAAGQAVKNKDLWLSLDELLQTHQINWHWVRGHSGNAGNECADALANQGIEQLLQGGQ